ncbi:hypothetical protein HY932_02675 [Candidatus Falkowbacteria bacterium]|nr:hypothetical protein [Candidatus Falkowbacteria bacterium]
MEIILGTIDRIEGNKLVIVANGFGEIIVPATKNIWREGDAVKLLLMKNDKADKDNQNLAKEILNNILDSAE